MSEKKISNAEAISVLENVVITKARSNGQNYIASALEVCLRLARMGESMDDRIRAYFENFADVTEVGLGEPVVATPEEIYREEINKVKEKVNQYLSRAAKKVNE